ncbi:MAG: hypothetical protein GWQ08_03895 [Verrucomicrobiaceae bacterium]|nr:hypothetical protein [Verrucomicrobiaceae bacterium]
MKPANIILSSIHGTHFHQLAETPISPTSQRLVLLYARTAILYMTTVD